MGIKIELTDDEIIEPSGGIAMFDLPGREFPGNEDVLFDLRWSVIRGERAELKSLEEMMAK